MKQWKRQEIKYTLELLEEGKQYNEIATILMRTPKSVRLKLNKLGFYQKKLEYSEDIICENCGIGFTAFISEKRKFCSKSCSASIGNKKYPKRNNENFVTDDGKYDPNKRCLYDEKILNNCRNCNNKTSNNKFCSIKCQKLYITRERLLEIEQNIYNPPSFQTGANWYKRYLIIKQGNKCMKCGWCEIHSVTKKVPIELNHIDGNSENNELENLELLCPNCHSLTHNYKALNIGNGRHNRRERYKNNQSY